MSVSYLLSRAFVCEGERRATHFIFNLASLYPTFRKKRRGVASSHIQKRITQQRTLSLDGKRGSRRATTFIRATGNTIPCHRFCMRFFFFRLQSAEDGCERDKVGSRQCANVPIQMSFQKSQIEKKRREDFKRGR